MELEGAFKLLGLNSLNSLKNNTCTLFTKRSKEVPHLSLANELLDQSKHLLQ
jgi:hypothetical protein